MIDEINIKYVASLVVKILPVLLRGKVSKIKLITVAVLFLHLSASADEQLAQLEPFLKQHCFKCHGPEKQKGDIRLDTLGLDLAKLENLEIWQGVLDQLNLGEMPPKKETQPKDKDVRPLVALLTD